MLDGFRSFVEEQIQYRHTSYKAVPALEGLVILLLRLFNEGIGNADEMEHFCGNIEVKVEELLPSAFKERPYVVGIEFEER